MPKWYKHTTGTGVFYSNEPKTIYDRRVSGDGSFEPTPKQALDLINGFNQDKQTYYNYGIAYQEMNDESSACELPSGTYVFKPAAPYPLPERLVPVDFRDDHYIELPKITENVMKDVNTFLSNEAVYRELKTIYKTGILLYGPGGTGKTAVIRHIVRDKLPKDAVVMSFGKVLPDVDFLNTIKETLKDRLKIFILEEFTHFVADPFDMEACLNFLDGEASIDRSIVFATTNYPEILPHNIVSRHSRIEYMHHVSFPDAEERTILMKYYLKREPSSEEIALTDKMTADSIKHICTMTHLKKISFADAKKAVDDHLKLAKNAFRGAESKIGF